MLPLIKKVLTFRDKYLFLLITISILLFFSPFMGVHDGAFSRIFFSTMISLVLFAGMYADIANRGLSFYIELVLGGIALIFTWLGLFFFDFANFTYISTIIYLAYFLYITIELIVRLILAKEITVNLIYASILGYLLMGLIGALVSFLIDESVDYAYNIGRDHISQIHNVANLNRIEDFIYYSFVTLSTVGYGDMIPHHPAAKAWAMFLATYGQIYLTIVVGLLIGKFLRDIHKA